MITSREIRVIPDLNELDRYQDFRDKYGKEICFEYNDFFHTTLLDHKEECEEVIERYLSLNRSRHEDTLHGVFIDMSPTSADSRIAAVSMERMEECMNIAKRLGVKAVIFHTDYIVNFRSDTYRDTWVNKTVDFYANLLNKYDTLCIYLENMFDEDPKLLARVVKGVNQERFGVCLDVAHAHLSKTPMAIWFRELWPYIRHLHINDNNKTEDSHSVLGEGNMDWQMIQLLQEALPGKQSALIEMNDYKKIDQSLQFLAQNRLLCFSVEKEGK